jgi:(S)-2-hydroxyglutarate dehydrogenase
MTASAATGVYDVAVVGGGIVGLASANALLDANPRSRIIVLEAESQLATHQTGHNSGVIHSGLYYKPGSWKAKFCSEGRDAMYQFCGEHGIPHERCGKIVVATLEEELPRLEELHRRGTANGLVGMKWLTLEEMREHEPNVSGIRGIWVPQTGIVDYKTVAGVYAKILRDRGCELHTATRVIGCVRSNGELTVQTAHGEVRCRALVNCGGLQSDRIARMCGLDPGVQIVPFRGEYYQLKPERESLVRNLIYPVPDPRFPFLGVHFTRMIGGGVEAGPNAVLAFKREGYKKSDVSVKDMADLIGYGGFWKMSRKHWKMGMAEFWRSFNKHAFVTALQRLMPALKHEDVMPGGSGVRAQAVDVNGGLLDDFHVVRGPGMIHVLNAPSPAATSSLRIGKEIASMAIEHFK